MNYKPFTTNNTKDIIKEIKDNLPNINKSIISIDTLDLCHLIGEIEKLKKERDLHCDFNKYLLEKIEKADKEIERLNNIIKEALRKLRATKDHYKIEDINNAIIYTIRILERSDK